eukprot:4928408-Alexandrium_andersonii.AAC.1
MPGANMSWDLDVNQHVAQVRLVGSEKARRTPSPRKEPIEQLTIQTIEGLGKVKQAIWHRPPSARASSQFRL